MALVYHKKLMLLLALHNQHIIPISQTVAGHMAACPSKRVVSLSLGIQNG
jgi:membrane-bound metal-dependent hydrolase YbcI (DUF457 family)